MKLLHGLIVLGLLAGLVGPMAGEELPPAETAIKDTVDHWGLPFSDQWRLYRENFRSYAAAIGVENPAFALGHETALRKTFLNKYWFKGQWGGEVNISAGRNEAEAFQLVVLPAVGAELKDIRVTVSALRHETAADSQIEASAMRLWRVGFVRTVPAQYPVRHVGDWPDPLLELEPFSLGQLDAGLIWCELKTPASAAPGKYRGTVTVSCQGQPSQSLEIRLDVWAFTLPDRMDRPTLMWTRGKAGTAENRALCDLLLDHHVDPISVGQTTDFDALDADLEHCLARGMTHFQTPPYNPAKSEEFRAYYEHIRSKGWLDKALIYSVQDEPTQEQFDKLVVPRTQFLRKEFPGLKTFLASRRHPGMGQGTDIWLTDLSIGFHAWLSAERPGSQEMWFYFCHLPIQVSFDRPLVDAPNMLIDNDAVEHRVLNWMAHHYGARGMFIWSANLDWPKGCEMWPAEPLKLRQEPTGYPYAGIHNGNGFMVYPGPRPSVRLKVLRDGIEDFWYLSQLNRLAEAGDDEAAQLLEGVVPTVFVNTHYFDRNPQPLLDYRLRIGKHLDAVGR
jgi:hypothetical protein